MHWIKEFDNSFIKNKKIEFDNFYTLLRYLSSVIKIIKVRKVYI